MEIGVELHSSLVNLISHIPVAEKPEGRDMLLNGIFNQNGWSRVPDNKRLDTYKIIDYLKHYFTGTIEGAETWGLIIFINNALREVEGTTTATKLRELRQRCIACWEDEQLERSRLISHKGSGSKEQTSSSLSTSEQVLAPPSFSEYSSSNFFETVACLIQIALESIELAEKKFHSSLSYPAKRRSALKHFEDIFQSLHQLSEYLEKVSPLPEVIANQDHILKNQIYYLIEQIKALESWIDISNGANQSIFEKFEEIKRMFAELLVLKGEDGTHQQTA